MNGIFRRIDAIHEEGTSPPYVIDGVIGNLLVARCFDLYIDTIDANQPGFGLVNIIIVIAIVGPKSTQSGSPPSLKTNPR